MLASAGEVIGIVVVVVLAGIEEITPVPPAVGQDRAAGERGCRQAPG